MNARARSRVSEIHEKGEELDRRNGMKRNIIRSENQISDFRRDDDGSGGILFKR